MFEASVLLFGAGWFTQQARAGSAPRASCCFTPELEPESLSIGDEVIRVDLGKAASLGDIPSAVYVSVPDQEIQLIVVRRASRKYVAVSRLCTHGSQVISYVPKRKLLQCNGFNHSLFDLDGRVVKGPAEAPLRVFDVELKGTILWISRKQRAQP